MYGWSTGAQFLTGRGDQWRVVEYFRMLGTENAWPSRACLEMVGVGVNLM